MVENYGVSETSFLLARHHRVVFAAAAGRARNEPRVLVRTAMPYARLHMDGKKCTIMTIKST